MVYNVIIDKQKQKKQVNEMAIYTKQERNEFKTNQTKTGEMQKLQRHIALFDAQETIKNFQNTITANDVLAFDNETRVLVSLGLTTLETAELDKKAFLTQAIQAEEKLMLAKKQLFGAGYKLGKQTEQTTYNTANLDNFLFEQGFLTN